MSDEEIKTESTEKTSRCILCGSVCDKKLYTKRIVIPAALAAAVGVVIFFSQHLISGERPTQHYEKTPLTAKQQQQQQDPEQFIPAELRANINQIEKDTSNIALIKSTAEQLVDIAREHPYPDILLETLELLTLLSEKNPADDWALLQVAELSFAQRVFNKAAEFYGKYLKIQSQDDDIRARYGSALGLGGQTKEAIAELHKVIANKPNHFSALTYLCINYAAGGDFDNAKKYGNLALAVAPNDEGKERLTMFLARLEQDKDAPKPVNERGNTNATTDPLAATRNYIKTNPIAGQKFASLKQEDGVVVIMMIDFPMSAMPDFAKEKFLGGIRATLPPNTKLKFVDHISNQVLFAD